MMAENDDDAWLEQLRAALASTPDEETDRRAPFTLSQSTQPSPPAQPTQSAQPFAEPPADQPAPPPQEYPEVPRTTPDDGQKGLAGVRDALRVLSSRLTAVESLTEDIARQSRRASSVPEPLLIEEIVTRVVRSELPAIIKEQLSSLPAPSPSPMSMDQDAIERWTQQLEGGEISAGEVVMLADELRARITQLEDVQRQALEQLNADRRQLIEGAVAEIRSMLFGQ